MTLAELNAMDRRAFVEALGWIVEDSPWVAERAWEKRPFSDLNSLQDVISAVVSLASPDDQVELLRAHPDLGAREPMSAASAREQGGVGLNTLMPRELERLRELSTAYRDKFGFPFLYAVKGSTKHDILNALERRLPSERDAEHQEALRQVCRIARFRLEDVVGCP